MKKYLFYNWQGLLKVRFFKDKVKIFIWIMSCVGFVVGVGFAYPALFDASEELMGLVEAMQNPVMIAMFGPVFDEQNYTLAVSFANQMLLMSMIIVSLMSILMIASMTRNDEEEGKLEMLLSLPLGRLSNPLSAIVIVIIMNVLIGLFIGVTLPFIPNESFTYGGSLVFGFALCVTGIMLGAITLLFAQLFENNRSVLMISFLTLGVMYLLRGLFDINESFLTYTIPLSWPLYSEVFVNNSVWFIVLPLIFSVFIILCALVLNHKRDLQAGYFRPKLGRVKATKLLRSKSGFILTLLKPSMIAWVIALFVLGLSYGSIFGDLDTFIENNDIFEEMLPGGDHPMNVQFMSIIMMVVAITASIGPIMIMNRLASEEKKNLTELLYANGLSRNENINRYIFIALIFSVIYLLFGSFGMIFGVIVSMDEPIETHLMLQAAFVYLPATLLMVGVTIFLVGRFPKFTNFIWIYLGYSFFAVYLGNVINLPDIFQWLSPYGHVNQVPIETFNVIRAIIPLIMSGFFIIFGVKAYNTRDLLG